MCKWEIKLSLTPKRPSQFLAKKHILKESAIDENKDKHFRSQPHKLAIDLLWVLSTKI